MIKTGSNDFDNIKDLAGCMCKGRMRANRLADSDSKRSKDRLLFRWLFVQSRSNVSIQSYFNASNANFNDSAETKCPHVYWSTLPHRNNDAAFLPSLRWLRQVVVGWWCPQSLGLIQLWFGSSFVWRSCRPLSRLGHLPAEQLHFCFSSLLLAWRSPTRCGLFLLKKATSGQCTGGEHFLLTVSNMLWCKQGSLMSVTKVLMEADFSWTLPKRKVLNVWSDQQRSTGLLY